jgi:hypothetical protein
MEGVMLGCMEFIWLVSLLYTKKGQAAKFQIHPHFYATLCFHQANKEGFFQKAGMKRMARKGGQGIPLWHLQFNNTVFPGTLHTGTTFTLPSA